METNSMILQVLEMLNKMKKSKDMTSKSKGKPIKRFSFRLKSSKKETSNSASKNSNGKKDHSNATENIKKKSFESMKFKPKNFKNKALKNSSDLNEEIQKKQPFEDPNTGNMISPILPNTFMQNKAKMPEQIEEKVFLGNSMAQNFHPSMPPIQHIYGQRQYYSSSPQYISPLGFNSNSNDINSFFQMHNLRMKTDQQMGHAESGGLGLAKSQQFCREHQTVANMVCLTDHKVICSNCALFGVHKGHDYCKFENFREKCQMKFKELKTEMEKTEFKWYIQEGGKEGDAIKKKVTDKKEELAEQVDGIFESVLKKIKDRQEEVKKEIADKFRKFERIINLRVSHHKNIKERVEKFTEKLEEAEKNMESHEMEFGVMFELFFQKGPKNAFEEIEKISQEIEIEKNNNSSFVEKELSRYKIESEQSVTNSFIKNQLARLVCEVSSMGESLRNVTSLGNSYDRNFYNKTPDQVEGPLYFGLSLNAFTTQLSSLL